MLCLRCTIVVLFCVVLHGGAAAEEPRALLQRAIQAHGGAKALERTKKGHLKATWKGREGDINFEQSWETTFDLPERYRETFDGKHNGQAFHQDGARNGAAFWVQEDKQPPRDVPIGPASLEQHWYAILGQLLLLDGKDTRLASVPDETKDGRTLVGFRSASAGNVRNFYFDKYSGLLARLRAALPNAQTGQRVFGEYVYENYRTIQGVRYPMLQKFSDGDAVAMEVQFSTVEFLDKIDAGTFAKPEVLKSTPSAERTVQKPSDATPTSPDRWLIFGTLCVGIIVGVVWLMVRGSDRGKTEAPPN